MKFWKLHENHICERRIENWLKDDHCSYIRIIILSRAYNEPIQRPPPSWLVSLISRALHWYCAEVKGSNSIQAWIIFRLSFSNCKSCLYNCHDHPSFSNKYKSNYNYHKKSPRILRGNFLRSFITLTIFYVEDCQTWTCCSFIFRKSNSYLFL